MQATDPRLNFVPLQSMMPQVLQLQAVQEMTVRAAKAMPEERLDQHGMPRGDLHMTSPGPKEKVVGKGDLTYPLYKPSSLCSIQLLDRVVKYFIVFFMTNDCIIAFAVSC